MSSDALGLVLNKLACLGTLDHADRDAIAALRHRVEYVPSGERLVREGQTLGECCVLLEGFACRHKTTRKGARQIVSFHLPGDILDVQHLKLPKADHDVETITVAKVAWISTRDLQALLEAHPKINDALWRDSLVDASIFREWVLNVGRRDAKTRIAHMLCEFAARRQAAGLGDPETFTLPMSQEQIADATGLTSVHVNRMLQALRKDDVMERDGREFRITNWEKMRNLADFDGAYLHQADQSDDW